MDRQDLKRPFTVERDTNWTCPTCERGTLRVIKDTFHKEERLHSRVHGEDAWDPDWIEYVYACLFQCSNDACREVVSSVGTGTVEPFEHMDENGNWEQDYSEVFKPQFFEPNLKLIPFPAKCADNIVVPLNESFRLFFSSPSAAANSIRIAVEALLTELKVKRFALINGKRKIIPLHQRIHMLPAKHNDIGELLLAIKWLGNAGSHGGAGISHDDMLDALELMEHVLAQLYSEKKKLTTIAKRVNKKKGPVKRRSRG